MSLTPLSIFAPVDSYEYELGLCLWSCRSSQRRPADRAIYICQQPSRAVTFNDSRDIVEADAHMSDSESKAAIEAGRFSAG